MRTKPPLLKIGMTHLVMRPLKRLLTPRTPWLVALALAGLATSPARAQQDASPLTLKAGYSVQTDSNLFRLPAGVDPVAVLGKERAAEQIGVGTLGLNFNTIQGLQTISADINAYNYRYRNFSYLDFAGINYDAAWRWAFTPRFTGNLTGQRTQTPTSFANYGNYAVRNVLTDTSTRLDGVFELYGPWRLVAGIASDRQANEQTVEGRNDYASTAADLGARLVFASGSTLSYSLKRYNGNYLNRALDAFGQYDSGFTQVDNEVRLRWLINPPTAQAPTPGQTGCTGCHGQYSPAHHFAAATVQSRSAQNNAAIVRGAKNLRIPVNSSFRAEVAYAPTGARCHICPDRGSVSHMPRPGHIQARRRGAQCSRYEISPGSISF